VHVVLVPVEMVRERGAVCAPFSGELPGTQGHNRGGAAPLLPAQQHMQAPLSLWQQPQGLALQALNGGRAALWERALHSGQLLNGPNEQSRSQVDRPRG
jgi:hypothetical protein